MRVLREGGKSPPASEEEGGGVTTCARGICPTSNKRHTPPGIPKRAPVPSQAARIIYAAFMMPALLRFIFSEYPRLLSVSLLALGESATLLGVPSPPPPSFLSQTRRKSSRAHPRRSPPPFPPRHT